MSRKRYKYKIVWVKPYDYFLLVCIGCRSKMNKQVLKTGESWWQNSDYRTRFWSKKQHKTEIWIKNDDLKIELDSTVDWKIVEIF